MRVHPFVFKNSSHDSPDRIYPGRILNKTCHEIWLLAFGPAFCSTVVLGGRRPEGLNSCNSHKIITNSPFWIKMMKKYLCKLSHWQHLQLCKTYKNWSHSTVVVTASLSKLFQHDFESSQQWPHSIVITWKRWPLCNCAMQPFDKVIPHSSLMWSMQYCRKLQSSCAQWSFSWVSTTVNFSLWVVSGQGSDTTEWLMMTMMTLVDQILVQSFSIQ